MLPLDLKKMDSPYPIQERMADQIQEVRRNHESFVVPCFYHHYIPLDIRSFPVYDIISKFNNFGIVMICDTAYMIYEID